MTPDSTKSTCLFTAQPLASDTREEHTLQRGVGGRIRSRVTSSDAFNQRCGETIDNVFTSVYAHLMNILSPLLSSEHQTGSLSVAVPGDSGKFRLEAGALVRPDVAILSRDKLGKPSVAMASDVRALKALARQVGNGDFQISTAPASGSDSFVHDCPTIRPQLEVAALKAGLLTFDHLLRHVPSRFTRSDALAPVRSFVQKAVMEGNIDNGFCHRCSLGMQYENLPLYQQMRRAITFAETPFEHVLLVAGYGPQRCIDLVWVVFGFDPFGFRLSYDWQGGSFAFGVVNGVLKGGSFSEAVAVPAPPDQLLCHHTSRRSCLEGEHAAHIDDIASHRLAACMEAYYLVDMESADYLQYNLVQSALCDPPHRRSVGAQILDRLRRFFLRSIDEAKLRRALAEVLKANAPRQLRSALGQHIEEESAPDRIDWSACIDCYRRCLAELRVRFGLPTGGFVTETRSYRK